MRIVLFFFVFVIIFCRVPPVSAQVNKPYSFSLCPQFGFAYGHAEEIVYPADTKADLFSQLLWDMKPVFYYGFLMGFSPVKPMERWGFFSGLSIKIGIPGPSGIMEDRDWMSVENAELTHYSTHDNIIKESFLLDFSAGLSFPVRNILFIKTFVNISYMNFRFYGENGYATYARSLGYGKYAPINDEPKEYSFSGKVISYSQEWFYAAPGVSLGYDYKGYFLTELFFMMTPFIMCTGLDEHIINNTRYKDSMAGGIMLEPGFRFSLSAGKWLVISWDFSWRYISGTRGSSYNRPFGTEKYKQEGEAGAGLSMLNTALLLKVRL
jgi:outer membrane protease